MVKESWIIIHKADKPDAVMNLPDLKSLAREDGVKVGFAFSDTDPAAPAHQNLGLCASLFSLSMSDFYGTGG